MIISLFKKKDSHIQFMYFPLFPQRDSVPQGVYSVFPHKRTNSQPLLNSTSRTDSKCYNESTCNGHLCQADAYIENIALLTLIRKQFFCCNAIFCPYEVLHALRRTIPHYMFVIFTSCISYSAMDFRNFSLGVPPQKQVLFEQYVV